MPGRILILGLGNPVRSDDGVGFHVVQQLLEAGLSEGIDAEVAGTAGLGLLELIAGYQRLVIVDAIDAGEPPGTVLKLSPKDLSGFTPLHAASSHDVDLATMFELGSRLGQAMPEEVRIVAVQTADITTFSEQCTPRVRAALDRACQACLEAAQGNG